MTSTDSINRAWYESQSAVETFSADDRLEPTLALLLIKYRDLMAGRDVLDIGVGAGRTTLYLSALTRGYVGIDYSPAMVAHSARRFPQERLELGDARDLSRFADASFDLVLFSYAGLGALAHESRLRALSEVTRVIRPGGVFLFSAHNRDYREARTGPRLRYSRNPLTQLAHVARWVRSARLHDRLRGLEHESAEYALINDGADGFRLLHYYISAGEQRAQLERHGLRAELTMDDRCREVAPDTVAADAPWLWYVARRAIQSPVTAPSTAAAASAPSAAATENIAGGRSRPTATPMPTSGSVSRLPWSATPRAPT